MTNRTKPTIKKGDRVTLRHGYPSLMNMGSLNSIMLHEEGYRGDPVEVALVDDYGYVVTLPSGYELRIQDGDVFRVFPAEEGDRP